VESLKETLAALTQSLPALPEQVREVLADAELLVAAGEALAEQAGEARSEADRHLEDAALALAELRDEAAEQAQGLEGSLAGLDGEVAELEELAPAQQRVAEAVDAIGASMDALKGDLAEGTAAIEGARQAFATVLGRIEERTRTAAQELQAGASAAEAAADAAQGAIETARSEIAGQVAAMAAAASAAQDALQDALQEAVGSLPGFAGELRSSLDAMRGDLDAALDDLKAQWRQHLEDELAPRVEHALTAVKAALAALDEHATEASGKWSEARKEAQTPLDAIREQLPALDTGVASVKEAASQVGLAWA
jgi:DNA repair exonuclease SbcCD ATPase subunit